MTNGILDGKQEILDYLECSDHKLNKYIDMGMPVLRDGGMWLAHKENIDLWFRQVTWPNKKRRVHKTPVK